MKSWCSTLTRLSRWLLLTAACVKLYVCVCVCVCVLCEELVQHTHKVEQVVVTHGSLYEIVCVRVRVRVRAL